MKLSYAAVLGAALWMGVTVSGAAHAETKIGYVNPAALLQESPQAEQIQRRLQQEFSGRRDELERQQKRIRDLEADLQKNAMLLSEEQRRKRERDVIETRREFKHTKEKFEDDLRLRQQEELDKLREELLAAVQEFAKQRDYDLILFEGVIYWDQSVDVTPEVLKRLN